MADERKIRVSCGDVTLQLTLGSKLLAKPFEEAVLKPFLKAYAKRTGESAPMSRVARVEVDEEMLGDHTIAASVVLLARETVDAEVFLRPVEVDEALRANELCADPFAPPPEIVPGGTGGGTAGGRTVHAPAPRDLSKDKVEFDEDNLTPIEKLKKERREARAARERLEAQAAASAVLQDADADAAGRAAGATKAAGSAGGAGEAGTSSAASAGAPKGAAIAVGARVRVAGLTSEKGREMNGCVGDVVAWRAEKDRWEVRLDGAEGTVNVREANLEVAASSTPPPAAQSAPSAAASAGGGGDAASAPALSRLAQTEAQVAALGASIAELRQRAEGSLAPGAAPAAAAADRAAARQQLSALLASINREMAGLDDLMLGDISDSATRDGARARKKAAAATLEGTLLPAARALQARLDEQPAPPPTAAAAPPVSDAGGGGGGSVEKASAEIDSDED